MLIKISIRVCNISYICIKIYRIDSRIYFSTCNNLTFISKINIRYTPFFTNFYDSTLNNLIIIPLYLYLECNYTYIFELLNYLYKLFVKNVLKFLLPLIQSLIYLGVNYLWCKYLNYIYLYHTCPA